MTVSSTINKSTYVADGIATVYAYGWLLPADSDMVVFFGSISQPTGWTVLGAGDPAGGTVTFAVPPPDQTELTLIRAVEIDQEMDLRPYDPFPAETVEAAFDKLTLISQDIQEQVNRSLKSSPGQDNPDDLLTAIEQAKVDAEAAAAAAAISETNAAASESAAAGSESTAVIAANAAGTSETNANTSEFNAATSETNASNSETAAGVSETNAAASESNAAGSAGSASTDAGLASSSASAAGVSETNAAASETAANLSAIDAANSAAAADPFNPVNAVCVADRGVGSLESVGALSNHGILGAFSVNRGGFLDGGTAGLASGNYINVPLTGLYRVTNRMRFDLAVNSLPSVLIGRNGNTTDNIAVAQAPASAAAAITVEATDIVALDAGDQLYYHFPSAAQFFSSGRLSVVTLEYLGAP